MKIFNNHRHLLFFIGGSLLLLAVLEGFWLKKLYSDERETLREKIKQTLNINFLSMQVSVMQKRNVSLIDSFMSNREKEEKERIIIFGGVNPFKTDFTDFIKNSQKTYYLKLDSLSKLPLGSPKDEAIIDSFLNEMRKEYTHRSKFVNISPKTKRDSFDWVETFQREQQRAYTSLWHLYRLNYSPQLNRKLMDSFFIALREHVEKEKMASFISSYTPDSKVFGKGMPPLSKQNLLRIFINSDTGFRKSNKLKDSLGKYHAYEFERFVTTFINPEDVKKVLDSTLSDLDLRFDVTRMKSNLMVPTEGNALVVTTSAGKKPYNYEKIAVAAYGYQSLIFKKIYPEILFALFVLGMIALSFWLIYRSVLQQKHLISLKNDFISNITHELKTPITTVGVAIEAMNSFDALKNPAQTKEYLDISKNELNRLSLLVDKVLKMAIFEQNEPQLVLETIDLNALTEQILKSMQLQFEKYNALVSFEKIGENFTLNADKTHITSVIYNLIDNALKYGGAQPQIHISLQAPFYDFIRFSVKDNGAGIPPQYQDKIFEKFFRIPTGDVHDTKGHGLGLSYVASVVGQHGGKINLESKEGNGSTFSVFLPQL